MNTKFDSFYSKSTLSLSTFSGNYKDSPDPETSCISSIKIIPVKIPLLKVQSDLNFPLVSSSLLFIVVSSYLQKSPDYRNNKVVHDFLSIALVSKGRDQLKKNVFFWALPELRNPPPLDPNLGNLVLFFSEVKIQDLKVSLELKVLYILYNILYNILYICNLKNS